MDDIVNYRGLWSAVILQAFVDIKPKKFLSPTPKIVPTGNKKLDAKKIQDALVVRRQTQQMWDNTRISAMRWLFSEDHHPCSFVWICDCLDLDKEWLRKMASSRDGIERVLTGKVK